MVLNGQIHAPAALTPRKHTRHPQNRQLGETHSRSGHLGEEISFLSLSGIEQFLERTGRRLVKMGVI
jgi:hypothetical protein